MPGYRVTTDPARLQGEPWVRSLLEEACGAPLPDAILSAALANAACVAVLLEGRPVAFVRLLTDGAALAWLAEVGIHPAHRGQGLSRVLMDAIRTHPRLQGARSVLLATRDPAAAFARTGFQRLASADVVFPGIDTPRLRLRELVAGDAEALFAIHRDGTHMRWYGLDPMPDMGKARQLIAAWAAAKDQSDGPMRWGIELREEPGALIGTCGLFGWNRNWSKCVLSYEIAPAHAGRGLMKEAVGALVQWCFTQRPVHRIEAQVHPDNAPSLALLAALGFEREGLLRGCAAWGGQRHDMVQLGLLRAG